MRTLFEESEVSNEEIPKEQLKRDENFAWIFSPDMQKLQHQILSFNDFTLDLTRGCLLARQIEVKLRPKSFEVLKYLVENSGRLVGKDELIAAVWPDTSVTDDSLVQCLIEVRRALNNSGQQMIKTVPRRGYIFEPEVVRRESAVCEMVNTEQSEGVTLPFEEKDKVKQGVADREAAARKPWVTAIVPRAIGNRRSAFLILAGASVLMLLVGYFATSRDIFRREKSDVVATSAAPIRSVAVMPLDNLSGDPAQEYFADGMTEELIGKLAQIGSLRVISRTSVMRYKKSQQSLPEIARELNVDAVLEGTVRRSDGRVHVTVRLVLAATDSPSWSREYDRAESDVLKLQSDVAGSVANEIRIQVTADERARLASARDINPQAHEAFLLGQYHLSKNNEQDMTQAIEYFERATQIAPDYAAAYAGLSNARLQRGWVRKAGANYKGVESQSRTAALKAITLDDQLAEAHNSLGRIRLLYDWDWAGAEHEFKRALELDPGSADAHIFYGHLLVFLGSREKAIQEGQIAVQLDPLSSSIQSSFGQILFCARKYQEALTHQKRAVELEPRNAEAYFRLADVYIAISKYDQAIAAFERVGELTPEFESFRAGIAHVYALMGKQREARQMIRESKADPLSIAVVYVALSDKDEAFRMLEKAVEERSPVLIGVKAVPFLEPLHSDPRWQTLLRRMNFPRE